MAVHHAINVSRQRNSGYRPSIAQDLFTPDPSLSPTHLSIRRGRATTTHYTHHQVSRIAQHCTSPSLPGVAHGPACEAGLSAGMRRERVPPQMRKKESGNFIVVTKQEILVISLLTYAMLHRDVIMTSYCCQQHTVSGNTWYSFITLTKCWPIFKILSLLDSAINLPRDSCYISHHTYKRVATLRWKHQKKQKNSKINISNTIPQFCVIVDKINQINLIMCVLLSRSNCYNILWHGCRPMETFTTLIKFMTMMTSVNWSSVRHKSGMSRDKV